MQHGYAEKYGADGSQLTWLWLIESHDDGNHSGDNDNDVDSDSDSDNVADSDKGIDSENGNHSGDTIISIPHDVMNEYHGSNRHKE